MAGTKISALTAGAALGGTEALPAVQTAATVKITADQIKTFTSASPTLVTPVLGVATGTSLALGGATIGTDLIGAGVSKFRVDSNGAAFVPGGAAGGYNINGGLASVYSRNSTNLTLYRGGDVAEISAGLFQLGSTVVNGWASGSIGASTDTGLSRISAGVIGVGTGAQGSVAGELRADTLQISNTVRADGGFNSQNDVFWRRGGAAATFQHGAADAASPVAQTVKFQDVAAGTSNTAGVNATIQAPAGTGTGNGGSLIFQVAPAGSAGSNKNAWTNALTIYSSGVAAVSNGLIIGANGVFSWSGKTALNSGADGSLTVSTNNGTTGAFTITAGASNLATFNGGITAGSILTTTASTTARASLNIPSGTAPTSPTNGDIWSDGSDLKVRLSGVTYTLTKA